MALDVIVDQNQLPVFSGTLTQAKWTVEDTSTSPTTVKTITASQIAGTGSLDILKKAAPGGEDFPLPELDGKEIKDVSWGGMGSCGFILTGEFDTPTGNNLKWYDNVLSTAAGMGWLPGEVLTINFK